MINKLLSSEALENHELAVEMLKNPRVSLEEKKKKVDQFIEDFTNNPSAFINEEKKNLLASWIELYSNQIDEDIKNRVHEL